jgi:hypothetical protein
MEGTRARVAGLEGGIVLKRGKRNAWPSHHQVCDMALL